MREIKPIMMSSPDCDGPCFFVNDLGLSLNIRRSPGNVVDSTWPLSLSERIDYRKVNRDTGSKLRGCHISPEGDAGSLDSGRYNKGDGLERGLGGKNQRT